MRPPISPPIPLTLLDLQDECKCGHPRHTHYKDGECCERGKYTPYICSCSEFRPVDDVFVDTLWGMVAFAEFEH